MVEDQVTTSQWCHIAACYKPIVKDCIGYAISTKLRSEVEKSNSRMKTFVR